MKKIVAVIGDAVADKGSEKWKIAFETGRMLVDEGYRVQTGGMMGVMDAVCQGAHSSKNYREGDTIAILPSFDKNKCNEYVDIVIPTGIDVVRNAFNGTADAVVVIGGGAGTLSEMAFAWTFLRLIIAYKNIPGWSSRIADQRIDDRIRYPEIPDDRVYGVETPEEVAAILREKMAAYDRYFDGISGIDPRRM